MTNFEVYCDESRQDYFWNRAGDGERYVLIGGVWIEADQRQEYKAKMW